jgi:hypothetical protein
VVWKEAEQCNHQCKSIYSAELQLESAAFLIVMLVKQPSSPSLQLLNFRVFPACRAARQPKP